MEMVRLVVDALGGDEAPSVVLAGVEQALGEGSCHALKIMD